MRDPRPFIVIQNAKHFRLEGAKLIPEPTEPDLFIEEAYRLWATKQKGK
jgi:hypothetical protein